jgi:hypothetical protein
VYSLHAFTDPGQVAALRELAEVRQVMFGGITADTGKALVTPERRGAAAPEKETA